MNTFMPLRKGIADDDRRAIPLSTDGPVRLQTPTGQHIDADALAGVLDQPRTEEWTGMMVRAWLWRVLLADGTRTLTTEGRWAEALTHIEAHRGVGKRMLDGRQVAVLAALVACDMAGAAVLLADTTPGDPWEQAVTACLTVLCRHDAGQPVDGHLADLAATYLERQAEPGMTVFDIRLGLTVLDAVGSAEAPAAHRIVEDLHRRTTAAEDGYTARENLAHPLFTAIATDRQAQDCRALVRACALGAGAIPDELRGELTAALRASDSVIRESLARPTGSERPTPMERA